MRRACFAAVLVLFALLASSASASPGDVVRDCAEDGTLGRNYSREELRKAAANLPEDVQEYSNCADVITEALATASAGKGKSRSGSAGSGRDGGGGAGGSDDGGGAADRGGRGRDGGGEGAGRDRGASGGSGRGDDGRRTGNGGGSSAAGSPAEPDGVTGTGRDPQRSTEDDGGVLPSGGAAGGGGGGVSTPLVAALVLLGVLALAGAAFAGRGRLPGGARDVLARHRRS